MKAAALALLATAASAVAVENVLPLPFPAERYTAMLEKSPFALATPVAPPPVAATKGFAADWYITGLARFEEQDYVSIKSRDLAVNFSLFGTEPVKAMQGSNESANGVQLVSVEWSNERGKSTVTIKKGEEIARLEFNQAELQATAMPMAPGAGRPIVPGQPGARPVVTPLQAPMPVTGAPMNPQSRTAIPRPSNAPVVTQPPLPPGTNLSPGLPVTGPGGATPDAGAGDNRRRIRVINPKQ